MLTWISLIGQFIYPVGGEGMGIKMVDREGDRYLSQLRVFTLLENIKIWYNIQVIINKFLKISYFGLLERNFSYLKLEIYIIKRVNLRKCSTRNLSSLSFLHCFCWITLFSSIIYVGLLSRIVVYRIIL